MAKNKTAVLICIASLCLLFLIGFLIVGIAKFSEVHGHDTGTTADANINNDSAGSTEPPQTNNDDSTETEPPQTDTETETSIDTEPPTPIEVKISLTEPSIALEEGESDTILVELSPIELADAAQLAVAVSDENIANASLAIMESGVHEITVTAVKAGECVLDIVYGETDAVSIAVKVTVPYQLSDPKPVPPAAVHDDIDPDKPMVALTFDDGPGAYTDRLLDILAQNNARATFLVVGNRISKHEDAIKRMVLEGHEVGVHTWDHTKLTTLSLPEIVEEVDSVRRYVKKLTGVTPRIVRPPYGSTNDDVKAVSVAEGFLIVRWNVDPEDWRTRDADATFDAIMSTLKSGNIILCHDIHKETVDSMERVIPELIARGYQLVTVSDLLRYSSTERVPGQIINKQ